MTVERRNTSASSTFDDLLSSYARLVSLFSDAADALADSLVGGEGTANTGAALAALRPLRKSTSAVAQALRLPPAYRLEQDSSLNERDVELLEESIAEARAETLVLIEWLRDAGGLSATATDDAAAREAVEDVRRRLLAHAQFLRRKEASLLRQRAASADHDARAAELTLRAGPPDPSAGGGGGSSDDDGGEEDDDATPAALRRAAAPQKPTTVEEALAAQAAAAAAAEAAEAAWEAWEAQTAGAADGDAADEAGALLAWGQRLAADRDSAKRMERERIKREESVADGGGAGGGLGGAGGGGVGGGGGGEYELFDGGKLGADLETAQGRLDDTAELPLPMPARLAANAAAAARATRNGPPQPFRSASLLQNEIPARRGSADGTTLDVEREGSAASSSAGDDDDDGDDDENYAAAAAVRRRSSGGRRSLAADASAVERLITDAAAAAADAPRSPRRYSSRRSLSGAGAADAAGAGAVPDWHDGFVPWSVGPRYVASMRAAELSAAAAAAPVLGRLRLTAGSTTPSTEAVLAGLARAVAASEYGARRGGANPSAVGAAGAAPMSDTLLAALRSELRTLGDAPREAAAAAAEGVGGGAIGSDGGSDIWSSSRGTPRNGAGLNFDDSRARRRKIKALQPRPLSSRQAYDKYHEKRERAAAADAPPPPPVSVFSYVPPSSSASSKLPPPLRRVEDALLRRPVEVEAAAVHMHLDAEMRATVEIVDAAIKPARAPVPPPGKPPPSPRPSPARTAAGMRTPGREGAAARPPSATATARPPSAARGYGGGGGGGLCHLEASRERTGVDWYVAEAEYTRALSSFADSFVGVQRADGTVQPLSPRRPASGAARLRPATPRSPRAATMPASTFKKLVVPEWAKDEREYAYVWPALPEAGGGEQAPLS